MKLIRRYKLKLVVNGEVVKVHKSDNREYIDGLIAEYKTKYTPDEVEFRISRSEIMPVRKPRREFKNLPEGFTKYYVNSDGGYYASDGKKIVRLYEI